MVSTIDSDYKTYAKATLDSSFKITDAEVSQLNDVSEYNLKMTVDAKSNDGGKSGSIGGDVSGNIVSKKHGDVKITGSITGSGSNGAGSMTMTMNFAFKDFTAELKFIVDASGNGEQKQRIELNGEEISADELQKRMGGLLATPSMGGSVSI
jgi:hypothetical protein